MRSTNAQFEDILYNHLIPAFCEDPQRRCEIPNFVASSNRVGEQDASDFVSAWNDGLIQHQGRGIYHIVHSGAREQFFWSGRKTPGVRSYTLWMEPIIAVATSTRLHDVFKWPRHLVSTKCEDFAFDVITTLPNRQGEYIAGEVKKTVHEIDQLVELMKRFGSLDDVQVPSSGKFKNAYKKVSALRRRRAPLFWAIGPEKVSSVFEVSYEANGTVNFSPIDDSALTFPATYKDF